MLKELYVWIGSLCVFWCLSDTLALGNEVDEPLAKELALLIRSARAVISSSPKIIEDPTQANLTAEGILEETKKNYRIAAGTEPAIDPNGFVSDLMTTIKDVSQDAISGKFKEKWTKGSYKNKFLPARFANEVAHRFNKVVSGRFIIRLTAPDKFLVNSLDKADDWERESIDKVLSNPSWEKGKVYFEVAKYKNDKVSRFLVPEYYSVDCLKCHGGSEGVRIHAGKISGKLGDLGGVVSLVILK